MSDNDGEIVLDECEELLEVLEELAATSEPCEPDADNAA